VTSDSQIPEMRARLPAERSRQWVEKLASSECPALTARRARRQERSGAPQDPIVWTRARGVNVWDADDNRYVDMSAGFGAAAVGHSAPRVVEAVQAQAGRLLHALGDLHPSDVKIQLLERLCALAPWSETRAILGLSGSDAIGAALKTALLHTRRPGVIAFEGGYHGLDHGALAACGYNAAFRAPFAAQLNPHVAFAPYPDRDCPLRAALDAVERVFEAQGNVGAVLIEPVLGRGGVVVPPAGFLAGLAALCASRGALLIADEVLTGLGRTGAMFRSQAEAASPDLICLGKALGGGLPISACIGRSEVMAAWGDPDGEALHTGTFFGNPLACAAALAALEAIERQGLCERAATSGRWLQSALVARLGDRVRTVRGAGLLIGIELSAPAGGARLARALLERGYISVPARADAGVLSLTPPLAISQAVLDAFVSSVAESLAEIGS
jgi:4-aminobutyrate aminotransferase-like enzyme